ncbi:DUF302 domain-containing protein [Oceanimonas doudoroffii]|uniref:DUF302 domain-containing protein n=1 Tax=Oceanimonas doudoroffii TaxID=84158 RepID=A0A233RHL2_9GAMM|nr:DUF302 domain-containing protein [Oceanimonas doudoroffii]OXY82883.1 hypothetical protein B6S08_05095 [Oceanimonas doudoroffii]
MKKTITACAFGALLSCSAMASDGMVAIPSQFSAEETATRFVQIVEEKGLTLFTRVNHAENATRVNLDLRPTEVILFGNPVVGTPLMQCAQEVAIELPQKALIWEDAEGKVWLAYNDPAYLKQRHNIQDCDEVIDKISGVLGTLSQAATSQ